MTQADRRMLPPDIRRKRSACLAAFLPHLGQRFSIAFETAGRFFLWTVPVDDGAIESGASTLPVPEWRQNQPGRVALFFIGWGKASFKRRSSVAGSTAV